MGIFVEGNRGGLCLASKLFTKCYGLISIGNGLSYACFRQVRKELVIFSAAERITLPFGTLCLENLTCLG